MLIDQWLSMLLSSGDTCLIMILQVPTSKLYAFIADKYHLYFESFAPSLPREVLKSCCTFLPFLFRFLLELDTIPDFLFTPILSRRWRRISGSAQPFPHSENEENGLLIKFLASNISASG